MKLNYLLVSLVIFSLDAAAQYSIGANKIKDEKVCDTCIVRLIHNSEEPVSYMMIFENEEDLFGRDELENIGIGLPYVSKHRIASGGFTLDFMFKSVKDFRLDLSAEKESREKPKFEDAQLQFQVSHNNQIIRNWTDIYTLGKDLDFQPFISIGEGGNKRFLALENYYAGKFEMNVNDSIVILIRNDASKQIVQSIFIKRVLFFPKYFQFIKFSSDIELQDILNKKISKEFSLDDIHENIIENFEMEPNEIALLRFQDPRVKRRELEYAFAGNQETWKTLAMDYDPGENPAYIIINKPEPGKTIELLLRYKQQPESVHRIKIRVGEKLTSTTWFKVAAGVSGSALLFAGWYQVKRRRHLSKLRRLTLKKDEIESKLQLLSGQLNPHFLFNSLNSVQNLINKQDTENANLYVSEVSSFLRRIMDVGKKEFISLAEELSIEEAYLELERRRCVFTYRIINDCRSDLSQVEFPPLLLQPIIENCLHHGFSRAIKSPIIIVKIESNEKKLIVSVEDNGQGFNPVAVETGHGLSLVQKRISLLNEKLSNMPIESKIESTEKGTVTTFTLQNWL